MTLDKIIYINLDKSPHRNQVFLSYMRGIDGASDLLFRFSGVDGRHYFSREQMVEEALSDNINLQNCLFARGSLGAIWSYLKCLHYIVEENIIGLILYDDRPLGAPVSRINNILERLEEEPEPFRMLQLVWGTIEGMNITESIHRELPNIPNFCYNLGGVGDCYNIYSPLGAAWMLKEFENHQTNFEKITHINYLKTNPGTYSYRYASTETQINPYQHYIHHNTQDRLWINGLPDRYECVRSNNLIQQKQEDHSFLFYAEHKRHLLDLPVIDIDISKRLIYPYKNDLAIGIPIFGHTLNEPNHVGHHVYAKSAVWAALRYLYATDIVELGIPIFFLVGELVADEIHPYLDIAGIPNKLRINSPQNKKTHFITKHTGIFDDALTEYERFIVFDVDIMPTTGLSKSQIFLDILQAWDTSQYRFMLPNKHTASSSPPKWILESIVKRLKSEDQFWQLTGSLQQEVSIDDFRQTMKDENAISPSVGGWCVGFSIALRQDPQFQDIFSKLEPICFTDGALLEMWLAISKEPIQTYMPPILWEHQHNPESSMLTHYYTTKGYGWRKQWEAENLEVLAWALQVQQKAEEMLRGSN